MGDALVISFTEAVKKAATYGKWLREGKISEAENEMVMRELLLNPCPARG